MFLFMWQAINNKLHMQLKIQSLINFLLSADTTLVHSFFNACFPIKMSKKKDQKACRTLTQEHFKSCKMSGSLDTKYKEMRGAWVNSLNE